MYLNKKWYLFLKTIAVIGQYLWGYWLWMMLLSFFLDLFGAYSRSGDESLSMFDIKMYLFFTAVFLLLFGVHFWLGKRLTNANIYNSLFVNDPDGVLQLPVLSRAIGKDISSLKTDIVCLMKMRILKNCRIEKRGSADHVVLFKDTGSRPEGSGETKAVCPNCGGEVMVRIGFVQNCPYCGSGLDV